jgi:Pectate lyase superfamily protein/F5/8 type C domain
MLACLGFAAFSLVAQAQLNGGWLTGVTATASSSQVPGYNGPFRVTSDNGLTETAPGSGVFQLSASEVGWTSQLPDENAVIQFDLGTAATVNRFRVWNYNEPNYNFRGFRNLTFQWSSDALVWKSSPQKIVLNVAPAENTYTGQEVVLTWPVNARYLRLWCDSTHRGGGSREQCGLSKVRIYAGGTASDPPPASGPFPATAGSVVNVREAPFGAAGNGVTDDYTAIQNAIAAHEGTLATLYFPDGTYRLSQPLRLRRNGEPAGVQRNGFLALLGQSKTGTILKLDNNVLTNPAAPAALLDTGYFQIPNGAAGDWYNINVNQLTLHTGTGNPGAIGLRFYANNIGISRDLIIKSGDGQGVCGLDCAYGPVNGPNLVKNIQVDGFAVGIRTGDMVASQTFENITLNNQTQAAWINQSQVLAIHNLRTTGSVPALLNTSYFTLFFPHVVLVDAVCTGTGIGAGVAAIENSGMMLLRDVTASGFPVTLRNVGTAPQSPPAGPNVTGPIVEYVSHPALQLFSGPLKTLRLPVVETPVPAADPAAAWINARNYRLTSETEIGPALQRAIDATTGTVFLPKGFYYLSSAVQLRGNLKRLNLFFSTFDRANAAAALELAAGTTAAVSIEDAQENFGQPTAIRVNAPRSLVVRNLVGFTLATTVPGARLFVENYSGYALTTSPGSFAWARQLNLESNLFPTTMITNQGGKVWVLGYKTEGTSTIATITGGGFTEILGGLNYSPAVPAGVPMFVISESRAAISMAEVNFSGGPFTRVVVETRGGVTNTLLPSGTPQATGGSRFSLFSSKR